KDDIKANLLALKLFKDSTSVAIRAQGCILLAAFRLLVLALLPMLVMMVPVILILGQMALWYQSRPLQVGEEAIVTLKLNGNFEPAGAQWTSRQEPGYGSLWPDVHLEPADGFEATSRLVRVRSKGEVCWNIKARDQGYHRLMLQAGDQKAE